MQRDAGMTNALRTVHRNKLKYYQALPPSQELTQCFLERYRGDHLTSFHVHRQADSAFILGASCPVAMKGDFVFHTLQDMTWEAKMTDIPHGKDIILFWLSNICMRSSGFSRCTPFLTFSFSTGPSPQQRPLTPTPLHGRAHTPTHTHECLNRPGMCCLPWMHVVQFFWDSVHHARLPRA